MPLSNIAVKNFAPAEKIYRRFDGEGLYIEIHPNGRKYWCMKYRFMGKERRAGFGTYPETSLAEARQKRADLKEKISKGIDPRAATVTASDFSFSECAKDWIAAKSVAWTPRYRETIQYRLDSYILPSIGNRDVRSLNSQDVLQIIERLKNRPELCKRILQVIQSVFTRCVIKGIIGINPATGLQEIVTKPPVKHHASLKESELPEFIAALNAHTCHPVTKAATKFLMLTLVRTTEMRWSVHGEFNLDKAEWRIPAERMKMRREHIVPLSRAALDVLESISEYNKRQAYLFPSPLAKGKPISENAVLYSLYDMGYKGRLTGHGFRSTASTILNERGFNADAIERQLAHVEGNRVRAAYNHAEYLTERREMLNWWADYLVAIGL